MWSFVILVSLIGSLADAQNSRGATSQDHSGHGWDIRLAVPGEPGNDYPTLGSIPRTSFSCAGKEPGYYADVEAGCQVFRICTVGSTYGFQSFLCPNGTLFNQGVFVCDWWMNVKCQDSQRLINTQNEKFGNLRLGPQLMKDIKKMLTYPMNNPYDKSAMKGNFIVMQDYRPPTGQLFPNSALIAGPERPPNNVYVPAKQIQQNYGPNDISFAASTVDTRYIPAGFTNQPSNPDAELFQRQRQIPQYVQSNNVRTTQHSHIGNLVTNAQTPQFTQNRNIEQFSNAPQPKQYENFNQANKHYNQSQRTKTSSTKTGQTQNIQRGHLNRQRAQFTDIKKTNQLNDVKQNNIGSYTKQQYNLDKQQYTYTPPIPPLPEELNSRGRSEAAQNLVSADVPSTVITKTLTYSKIIQDPKPGRPQSRVTVKTWIVKPKSARLITEPTSYVYTKPTQMPKDKLIVEETSPYVYNQPTNPPQSERVIQKDDLIPYLYNRPTSHPQSQRVEDEPKPYIYNRPPPLTSPQTEILDDDEDLQPYTYNRPTVASKPILTTRSEPSRAYLPPSPTSASSHTTRAARINIAPPVPPSTKASKVYPAPTTFKPAARLYLPPDPQPLSRQYLASNTLQQPTNSRNSQLRVAPTNTTTTYTFSTGKSEIPSYSVRQSQNSDIRNNLTFTDILTKEKLDLTVNDIVQDTGKILQTASPPQIAQYGQNENYPNENYLPAEQDESGEDLTSQSPSATSPSKSSRLLSQPARELEPPIETLSNNINTNPLASLPFFKAPPFSNTIERTVSLKITIPEKVAAYLFKGGNESDFDRLEVLNTGSSNYLVLSNHLSNQIGNPIAIDKGLDNRNSNLSNSQGLVFSLLADSLNAAKEYNNIVKQDVLSSTTPIPPSQNLNNEDLTQITDKVTQLTSSQFSNNHNLNTINISPTAQTTSTTRINQLSNTKLTYQNLPQQIQTAQYNLAPALENQKQFVSQYQTDINDRKLLDPNHSQIYSGQLYQLPVPEVTNQIYNRPQTSADLVQTNLQQNTQTTYSPQTKAQNNNIPSNNLVKQSSSEIEVQSQTLPLNPPKLQLELIDEPESFHSQESLDDLLNSDNGISAQLQDKIVGVIPHPLDDNKLLTYEKDQSYYLYTKFDKGGQYTPYNIVNRSKNIPSVITFQFVPSVSYQLEDEKEQQNLLNTFQIDEFGAPRNVVRNNIVSDPSQQRTLTSSVDYSVEHPKSGKQINLNPNIALYKGPSSYSAPQGSVGSLPRQALLPNYSSRLELLNGNSEGYAKSTPTRRFVY